MQSKNFITFLFLFFLNLCLAQNRNIDKLIQNINNDQAYIVLTKTMSPRVAGNSAKEIVDIGKNATPELIRILDSKDKGIVAHFILSEIWNDKWKEEVCCYIKNMNDEEIVTINGLEIHIKNNALFSTTQSLNNNKQNWKIFWQT